MASKKKSELPIEIVQPVRSRYYSEDDWGFMYEVDDVTLQMSFVRRRLAEMADYELNYMINRVEKFAEAIPDMPLTEKQRDNARKLIAAFKSIFVVERRPERKTA